MPDFTYKPRLLASALAADAFRVDSTQLSRAAAYSDFIPMAYLAEYPPHE